MYKWNKRQKIAYWFFKKGPKYKHLYDVLMIPYHFSMGLYYKFKLIDILDFCWCMLINKTYPFITKRPDLKRS